MDLGYHFVLDKLMLLVLQYLLVLNILVDLVEHGLLPRETPDLFLVYSINNNYHGHEDHEVDEEGIYYRWLI